MPIDPGQFLEAARPALETGDAHLLAARVRSRWAPRTIGKLLRHSDSDVRRVAAITLGLVGDESCVGCLARTLHDPDEQVNEMAEHGLWSIWFRSCDPEAVEPFQAAMAQVAAEAYEGAVEDFRQAIQIDPEFAEAYHQCSIARFFLGQWRGSIEDAQQTLLRQPCHFGAMAGMGHCYVHLDDLRKALDCYRRAIAINPRMVEIAQTALHLERELKADASLLPPSDTSPFANPNFRIN